MIANILISKIIGSVIRQTAAAAGGWMLANGVADAATVEAITGGAVAAGAVALSLAEKRFKVS
jgi:hypothetical protein